LTSTCSSGPCSFRRYSSSSEADCYSIKPIDGATLAAAATATSGRIVVAEDHHREGGLGSAVAESLLAGRRTSGSLAQLAVHDMPGSGSGNELLAWAGIDADHIADAARRLLDARQWRRDDRLRWTRVESTSKVSA
jgi:transketolase C-terminal domain/subunit